MGLKKTHDAVYGGEKYTDKNGDEKTRFINVGSLFQRDDGSQTMKLESIPVGFNGWISFYEPKPKDGQDKPASGRPARTAPAGDFAGDPEIPF